MCLFPKLIVNRKYSGTIKNKGNPPALTDERVRYVPVACGNCLECRKAKANEWRIRLHEEIKVNNFAYFITLSFSNKSLLELSEKGNTNNLNAIATKGIRLFLERIRKKYKKSLKHWLITELGQNNTERIHLHGIIFSDFEINNNWLQNYWKYGHSDTGQFCNAKTINYIVKYLYKIDTKHKDYKPIILCSKGIGKSYINEFTKQKHKYKNEDTKEFYTLPNGQKLNLPIYYRNKFYSEEEREKLWIQKIEKDTRYINGIKIENVLNDEKSSKYFFNVLKQQQKINIEIGFGDDSNEWKKKDYNLTLKMLKKSKIANH